MADARSAWRWYAGAWAWDAGTTALSLARGGQEANPLLGDRPALVLAAKAAVAAGTWRAEVAFAGRGRAGWGRAFRWVFVGISAIAGGYNVTIAW